MHDIPQRISSKQLIHNLIPKLDLCEKTLASAIVRLSAKSESSDHKARVEALKSEYELELLMIKMNLEHLLARYEDVIKDKSQEDMLIDLDDSERIAIAAAEQLTANVKKHFSP